MDYLFDILFDILIKLLVVVLVIALVAFAVSTIRTEQQLAAERSAAWNQLERDTDVHKQQIQQLKLDLASAEVAATYVSDHASIMVGFLVSDASDFTYMQKKAEQFGFTPVLVVDCTMGASPIGTLLRTAPAHWEIMLYAPLFSAEINQTVLSVRSYLLESGRKDTGIFFLRKGYDTQKNLELLLQDGFVGYTSFHNSPTSGQNWDGSICFDYSNIKSDNTSVTERLSLCYTNKASMIYTLSMSSIRSQDLSDQRVDEILEEIQSYTDRDDCSFATVAEVYQELNSINYINGQEYVLYKAEAARLEQRIQELEQTVDQMYADFYEQYK